MKDINELQAKVETLRSEIADLDALDAPTEEQTARFDAALSEFDAAKAAHDALVERAPPPSRRRTGSSAASPRRTST